MDRFDVQYSKVWNITNIASKIVSVSDNQHFVFRNYIRIIFPNICSSPDAFYNSIVNTVYVSTSCLLSR